MRAIPLRRFLTTPKDRLFKKTPEAKKGKKK